MSKLKTRSQLSTHLSLLVGKGKELPVSELPTVRDMLRLGLLLREKNAKDRRNYTDKELINDMIVPLLHQWTKANALFKPPVINQCRTIELKLTKLWHKAVETSLGKGNLARKNEFLHTLDTLFDILTCKCSIQLCSESNCSHSGKRENNSHIDCGCPREKKIPVLELEFIKAQRTKAEGQGSMQMGSIDYSETKKQIANAKKREQIREREQKKKMKSEEAIQREEELCQDVYHFFDSSSDEQEATSDDSSKEPSEPLPKKMKYNTRNISNIALASIRHHAGLREAAEIATAAWIDAGLISREDVSLVIDHNKIRRAQEKIMKEISDQHEKDLSEGGLSCLLFDGRIDDTKVLLEVEGVNRKFPGLIKEEHYSVCSEPGGRFLFHFAPETEVEGKKHAEVIADHILCWVQERGLGSSLQAVGGDSTAVNTGWQGGVMTHLEKKLGRRLVWIVCDLHTGELPLRHLIQELDGPTKSNNKWSGPLGIMLDEATQLEINTTFPKVEVGPPLPALSEGVIKDLSTDQSYAYRIAQAIRSGEVPQSLALLEIGPVSHSCWLTTALRFCRIWISKHELKGKVLKNLRLIVEFIIGVYLPQWFSVKLNPMWVDGPNHLLFQLQLVRTQRKVVRDIVLPVARRSAWYARSEAVLQAMLCSQCTNLRTEAVEVILKIRGTLIDDDQLGDCSFHSRKVPPINVNATKLSELVDLSLEVLEPPLTTSLTSQELRNLKETPMQVPKWPSHTQSVERCVKMVTEAAGHVYSHERREGYIKAQIASRLLMTRNQSKESMKALVTFK